MTTASVSRPPNRPARPPGSAATLITVAPTGAEHAKADLPQLPTTLDELVETARRCEAAGASLIHLHLRYGEHRPTLDAGRLRAAVGTGAGASSLRQGLVTGKQTMDLLRRQVAGLDAKPAAIVTARIVFSIQRLPGMRRK